MRIVELKVMRGNEAGYLTVTMKEPDAGIIGHESDNGIAAGSKFPGITTHGNLRHARCRTSEA